MGVELVYPIHHQLDIPVQLPQCGANGAGLFTHPCIFEDGPHRVQSGHAGGGGDNPYTRFKAFADQLREI